MSIILKQEPANSVPTPPFGKGTLFLDENNAFVVKSDAGNYLYFPTVTGANTQVFFNDNGSLAGDANFTYDSSNSSLTIVGNVTATYFIGDGSQLTNVPIGTVLANGNSNVSIPVGNGNVTINVSGNDNVAVISGTGVFVTGNLSVTGNANIGNVTATNGAFSYVSGNGSALSAINAANVTGTVANATYAANAGNATSATTATTAGTVTTAAQPNITSVGTLTGLGVNGNLTAVNITSNTGIFSGNGSGLSAIAGANVTGIVANATYATSAGTADSATTAGTVTTAAQPNITSVGTLTSLAVTGNITGGNLSVSSGAVTLGTLTTGANTTAGTITGNWSLSAGSRLNATYADLAERYVADAQYEPGTVLIFGGEHEVTMVGTPDSTRVAGVVTTNPAYLMNSECEGEFVVDIALIGRVPIKVQGPVAKGDLLVTSEQPGFAKANNEARAGTIIGKALQSYNGPTPDGVIEAMVGRC